MFTFFLISTAAFSQSLNPVSLETASITLPDAPEPKISSSSSINMTESAVGQTSAEPQDTPKPPPQPKRILGLMPNYRAVSAGQVATPPGSKEAFIIATRNSFDYSAFVFTGLTSLIAEANNSHPDFGKGVSGYWSYTWRGFIDKTDGNYLVIWAYPTVLHQDVRYYALGKGSVMKRLGYSISQIAIARDYRGGLVPNYSELLGRASAQAISKTYYPASANGFSQLSSKFAYALLRDGATNAFREFWPDIAVHVLHRHP